MGGGAGKQGTERHEATVKHVQAQDPAAQLVGHDHLQYRGGAGEKEHLKYADEHQGDQRERKPGDLRKEDQKWPSTTMLPTNKRP